MKTPLLVAGPCSAESQEQILTTAAGLTDVGFFRAGIWKPRTKPGTFEGVGERGLPWLAQVQTRYGIPACTEVASAQHVQAVRKAGLKGAWIGARTTANPFLVEEIAQALEGSDMHVFVKNPINPELELWIGAVQRLQKHGLTHLYAIHRGFSDYHVGQLRNAPLWMVPINFKTRMPDIPLLCDPSHLTGNTAFIQEIAQRALDLNFDGLMLEVHPNPSQALSDAKQQLTVEGFCTLINTLQWRKASVADDPHSEESILLEALRARIDVLDEDLVDLLSKRMLLADNIGEVKKRGGIGILQIERWNCVTDRVRQMAEDKHLDQTFIEEVYRIIHQQSIKRQEAIISPNPSCH